MVIGCCGSGKSTFSRRLAEQTSLPVYHLDQYYWKANWREAKKSEWEPIVEDLAKKESWIIDGNYKSTMDIRIQEADTIIYLDRSTPVCLWRVIKRIFKYHGKVRPDMPAGCRERFDWDFLHYVAVFNLIQRRPLLNKIGDLGPDKSVHVLRSNASVDKYLHKHFK